MRSEFSSETLVAKPSDVATNTPLWVARSSREGSPGSAAMPWMCFIRSNGTGSALAAKEALTNVDRHAHADHVIVRLIEGRDSTMVEVIDDGAGSMGPAGLGLTTTKDRIEAIGGGIELAEAKGGGTRFVAWVPRLSSEST